MARTYKFRTGSPFFGDAIVWGTVLPKVLSLVMILAVLLSGCGRKDEERNVTDLVAHGWEMFRMGEYGVAVGTFERALNQLSEDDPDRIMAIYGLATTWSLRMPTVNRDRSRARDLYEHIIATTPKSDLAPWAALALVRMDHLLPVGEEPNLALVRSGYRALIDRYSSHAAAEEAFLYLQSTFVAEMNPVATAQAVKALEGFVRQKPNSGYRSAAYGLLQSCYELMNEPEKQLHCLIMELETREIDPTNPKFEKSWAYWRIATVAEFEVGNFDIARKYHKLLLKEYPMDGRGFAAETALKRMDEMEVALRNGTCWPDSYKGGDR